MFIDPTKKNVQRLNLFFILRFFFLGTSQFVVTILRHIEGKLWIPTKLSCRSGKNLNIEFFI